MPKSSDITILLVEDDEALRAALAVSLRHRGYRGLTESSIEDGKRKLTQEAPQYAVIDFNLGRGDTGLDLVRETRESYPEIGLALLTGFASISTAVEAMRLGVRDVLLKPVDAVQVLNAFGLLTAPKRQRIATKAPVRLKSQEMADIRKIMALTDNNISETARRLGMHRRSLQRKLANYG